MRRPKCDTCKKYFDYALYGCEDKSWCPGCLINEAMRRGVKE